MRKQSKARHAPGPWKFETDSGAIIDGTMNQIAGVLPDNRAANAHLIAAAPDLLEALEECVYHVANSNDCMHGNGFTYDFCPIEKARAAIARAKGEDGPPGR